MSIGSSLSFGGCCFLLSKRNNFPRATVMDWSTLLAGCCYTVAACLLVFFRETPLTVHMGTETACQGAWPLTIFAYTVSAMTVLAILLSLLSPHCAPLARFCRLIDDEPVADCSGEDSDTDRALPRPYACCGCLRRCRWLWASRHRYAPVDADPNRTTEMAVI